MGDRGVHRVGIASPGHSIIRCHRRTLDSWTGCAARCGPRHRVHPHLWWRRASAYPCAQRLSTAEHARDAAADWGRIDCLGLSVSDRRLLRRSDLPWIFTAPILCVDPLGSDRHCAPGLRLWPGSWLSGLETDVTHRLVRSLFRCTCELAP